ncbi:MAG: hypothetical protein RJA81_1784, partial [Planctomycetota bacterium]
SIQKVEIWQWHRECQQMEEPKTYEEWDAQKHGPDHPTVNVKHPLHEDQEMRLFLTGSEEAAGIRAFS